MHETILDRLAKRASFSKEFEESILERKTKKALSNIKRLQRNRKRHKSSRGGLSSMGARGVFLKDADIYSRRVIVKSKFKKNNGETFKEILRKHIDYLTRGGADRDGKKPSLFSSEEENIEPKKVYENFSKSPHSFRFIISPEDSDSLDLKSFTMDLMKTIEQDLGTKIDWVAAVHYDTNDPHVHMVINGKDKSGDDLFIKRDYITHGIRNRASTIISNKLGLRSLHEVINSLQFDVTKNRKCGIDDIINRQSNNGKLDLNELDENQLNEIPKVLFIRRIAYLESKGIAKNIEKGIWQINANYVDSLRDIDRSNQILGKLSSFLKVNKENCQIQNANELATNPIEGHVLKRGRIDEAGDNEYLVIRSKDNRNHYIELEKYSEKAPAEIGEWVRVECTKPFSGPKLSDQTIDKEALKNGGTYDAKGHTKNTQISVKLPPGVSAQEYVQAHVKRLEVLVRRGLVEKLSDSCFLIPKNYLEQLSLEAQKSKEDHKPHIKVTRLSPPKIDRPKLSMGLKPW
jgi:type IV secretory pathway VirD2 relaxase